MNPIYLPRHNRITELIVLQLHENAAIAHTLSEVRQQFWIPKGRTEIKRISQKYLKDGMLNHLNFQLCRIYQNPD